MSLGADLGRVSALLSAQLPRIEKLEAAVGAGEVEAGLGGFRPVAWAELDPSAAAAAWDELGVWVRDVLTPTVEPSVRQVPPCWPVHSWGRETLSWLHGAYRQAYGPAGSGFQVAEWHTRWVPHAYAAFEAPEAAQGGFCARQEHSPAPGADRGRRLRVEDWQRWFDRARAADLEHRRPAGTAQAAAGPRAGEGVPQVGSAGLG
ncbi:hypothetical protein [Pseudonocardia sp. Ae717_Ps2]|uniref:hypothetical protein n=1 Tax=Pseudonocardia sp. Ae717_Ps2 TaxID=1885573 RepID=UPI0013016A28|nr:hypothetical protein [Pseudonocardia sp. Ae717_Ps2]